MTKTMLGFPEDDDPSEVISANPSDFIKKTKFNNLHEIGSTGLSHINGLIDEEFMSQLKGSKAQKVYREMSENDPVVGAYLFAIEYLIRAAERRIDPSDDSPEAKLNAEFIIEALSDMSRSWEDTMSEIVTMLVYGFSPLEIVYKKRVGLDERTEYRSKYSDGKIGWRKLSLRAQDTVVEWDIDENGGIQGFWQQAPPKQLRVYIPIEKLLLFRTSTVKNNPQGVSQLRRAYRPYYFKKRIEEYEAVGIERDLAGLPVVWVPSHILSSQATPDDTTALTKFKQLARDVKFNEQEGIVMPLEYDPDTGNKVYDFTLMSSPGKRQYDTDAAISRYNQLISMTVLADFILLGHERVGSKALGVSKIELFATAIETWCRSIADVFETHGFYKLLKINGMDVSKCPKLVFGKIQQPDLEVVANFLEKLVKVNVITPDDELEDHIRDISRLPLMEETRSEPRVIIETTDQNLSEKPKNMPENQPKNGKNDSSGEENAS